MSFYQQVSSQYEKATPTQKSYLNIILTLILLIILIPLIFLAVNHILKLNKEIADGRLVEQKLIDKIGNLNQAQSNYDTVKDRLKIIDTALPTGSHPEDHLRQLESIARSNKVKLAGIQFTSIPLSIPGDGADLTIKQVNYEATVEGTYPNLQKFLADLESLVRTADLSSVAITSKESLVSATIKATTYYLGESLEPGIQANPSQGAGGTGAAP